MHMVVMIKQVPDSAQIRIHPVTNTIMRQGVPAIVNPYDLFSLEEALRLKDQHGGRVTVITMGPPMAEQALRKCLSFGADDAILLTDRRFAGADTLATSYALHKAVQKAAEEIAPVDILFAGKQTIDGDTAQVGPGVATRMGMEQLTYIAKIREVDLEKREIEVERRAEGGVMVLRTKLPCMITMLEGTNEIRFGTMDDMFRAARAELKVWDRQQAGIDDDTKVGMKGSPTVVSKVFAPKPRSERSKMIEADGGVDAVAAAAVETLLSGHPGLAEDLTGTGA